MSELVRAINDGDYSKILDILLDGTEDINGNAGTNEIPLIEAVRKPWLDVAKRLITYGADQDIQNSMGYTALMVLIENGEYIYKRTYSSDPIDNIFDILLERTNPNIQNLSGKTALMFAVENGAWNEWEYAMKLVKISDCSLVDIYNHSALYYIIYTYINNENSNEQTDIRPYLAQYIIDQGANIQGVDNNGYSLFDLVIAYQILPMIEILFRNGALLTDNGIEVLNEMGFQNIQELINQGEINRPIGQIPMEIPPNLQCYNPLMASEEDITNKHTVFYIFNNTMTLSSVACLDAESFHMLYMPEYIYYKCRPTVPLGALFIDREDTDPEPIRRLTFDKNIYVYESQVKQIIKGKKYAIRPTEQLLGRIAAETLIQSGNAVGAEHCQTDYPDQIHEIFEIVKPAEPVLGGGRRKGRKTYKRRKQQKKHTRYKYRK